MCVTGTRPSSSPGRFEKERHEVPTAPDSRSSRAAASRPTSPGGMGPVLRSPSSPSTRKRCQAEQCRHICRGRPGHQRHARSSSTGRRKLDQAVSLFNGRRGYIPAVRTSSPSRRTRASLVTVLKTLVYRTNMGVLPRRRGALRGAVYSSPGRLGRRPGQGKLGAGRPRGAPRGHRSPTRRPAWPGLPPSQAMLARYGVRRRGRSLDRRRHQHDILKSGAPRKCRSSWSTRSRKSTACRASA